MEKFKITKKAKIAMAAACAVIAAFGGISFAQRTTLADYKNITLKRRKRQQKKPRLTVTFNKHSSSIKKK